VISNTNNMLVGMLSNMVVHNVQSVK